MSGATSIGRAGVPDIYSIPINFGDDLKPARRRGTPPSRKKKQIRRQGVPDIYSIPISFDADAKPRGAASAIREQRAREKFEAYERAPMDLMWGDNAPVWNKVLHKIRAGRIGAAAAGTAQGFLEGAGDVMNLGGGLISSGVRVLGRDAAEKYNDFLADMVAATKSEGKWFADQHAKHRNYESPRSGDGSGSKPYLAQDVARVASRVMTDTGAAVAAWPSILRLGGSSKLRWAIPRLANATGNLGYAADEFGKGNIGMGSIYAGLGLLGGIGPEVSKIPGISKIPGVQRLSGTSGATHKALSALRAAVSKLQHVTNSTAGRVATRVIPRVAQPFVAPATGSIPAPAQLRAIMHVGGPAAVNTGRSAATVPPADNIKDT